MARDVRDILASTKEIEITVTGRISGRKMQLRRPSTVPLAAVPVQYVVFDVPYLGRGLTGKPSQPPALGPVTLRYSINSSVADALA